jgi:DNA mismatch endonuclease (patch repair protein)
MGFRFSLKRKDLPGHPDIVLPKHKTAVFVHGCFWHRHKYCKTFSMPKSRVGFWKKKFDNNVKRDRKNQCELRKLGWKVIVLWECQATRCPEKVAGRLFKKLDPRFKDLRTANIPHQGEEYRYRSLYSIPEKKELLKIAEKRADYKRTGTQFEN